MCDEKRSESSAVKSFFTNTTYKSRACKAAIPFLGVSPLEASWEIDNGQLTHSALFQFH